MGFDVHRLVPERELWLGGVKIEHELGLLGHSDADVAIHALCDALLGAAALGDIGTHFPDNDAAYKGIDSAVLLQKTVELLRREGWTVNNADVTVVLERPKLVDYKPLMRDRLADLLGIPAAAMSVKAKSNEGMGFTGCGEGVAVMAAVTIRR